ncbi:hypothetical protein EDD37DRAFT_335839 [Exophiala viscosa]|uniref:uncharacterized protein n=1 Tax=Exophiala viscosa TaxID=2486360 RepID=UPI0021A0CD07|nr:hypothetical protein EDD37DRAFT_335839 [Exophiala viscosa]
MALWLCRMAFSAARMVADVWVSKGCETCQEEGEKLRQDGREVVSGCWQFSEKAVQGRILEAGGVRRLTLVAARVEARTFASVCVLVSVFHQSEVLPNMVLDDRRAYQSSIFYANVGPP